MEKLTQRLNRYQIGNPNLKEATMKAVLRVYTKAANQRLKALEKAGLAKSSNAYRYMENQLRAGFSYVTTTSGKTQKRKRRDTGESYEVQTEDGHVKFRTNFRGMSMEEMRQELRELDTFLFRSKTSTVKGVKEHYKKIKESIENNRYNRRVAEFFKEKTMEEFAEFWENQQLSKVYEMFGSSTAVEVVQAAEGNSDIGGNNEVLSRVLSELDLSRVDGMTLINHVRNWSAEVRDYDFNHISEEDRGEFLAAADGTVLNIP